MPKFIESLEKRRLFDGFAASIHFQPTDVGVPSGFLADNGGVFGDRGNGLSYGWKAPARVVTHHLSVVHEPDPLYDSFAVMKPGNQWRIAVPNGSYQLDITAGDPLAVSGRESIDVNGALFLDGQVNALDRWVTGSSVVNVTDGYITLTVPSGGKAKIDFLDIGPVGTPSPTLIFHPDLASGPPTPNQAIFAVAYNQGGEGVAYHDTTAANLGGDNYRPGDAVDIQQGGSSGHIVTYAVASEWLDYTISVPAAGTYTLDSYVSSTGSGGAFHAEFEGTNLAGQNLTGPIAVPDTLSSSTFAVTISKPFALPAGTTIMRIVLDKNSTAGEVANFDWFKIVPYSTGRTKATTPGGNTPFLSSPFQPGQTIDAVFYDNGGDGVAYYDTTPGNQGNAPVRNGDVDTQYGGKSGVVIGHTAATEWLDYTIVVPTAGTYALQAAVANSSSGGLFHAEFEGTNLAGNNLTDAIAIPNTGSFSAYQTITSNSFTLPVGQTVMRIVMDKAATDGAVGNFDWFSLVPASTGAHLTWHAVAPIPLGMTEAMGETVNGKLYVFGGYTSNKFLPSPTVFCYDPTTNTWTRKHDMPNPTTHTGTAVDGQYIYLAGGYPSNAAHTYQIFTTVDVWRYDTVSDTWTAMPNLPQGRGAGNLAQVNNVLYYFSGADATRVDRHEVWSLNLNNLAAGWQACAPIPTARNHVGAVALDGLVFAIGGAYKQDSAETALNAVEAYNPATNTWVGAASLPTPLALIMAGCTSFGNHIIVAGGETAWNVTQNAVREYDPTTGIWSSLTPLPLKRESGILKDLGNGELIYATGHPGFNTNVWIGTFG